MTYSTTHNGVLLPGNLRCATEAQKDRYAESVKRANDAFVIACFELEDEAERLGVELDA